MTPLAVPRTTLSAPGLSRRVARVVASDTIVLRRRVLLVGTYAAAALVTALVTVLTFATAGDEEGLPPGPAAQAATSADLAASTGPIVGVTSAVSILGVIAVCVCAAHVAGMFTTGTVRNALVRSPGRVALVAGKVIALSVFLLGAVAVAAVAGVVTAVATAPPADVDTSAWTGTAAYADCLVGIAYVVLSVVGYGITGTVLGLALRAPIPAVALAVGWLLPLETILIGTVDGSERWLPGQLLSALAAGGTDDVGLARAAVTVGGYLAVGLVLATARFVRGDVTA